VSDIEPAVRGTRVEYSVLLEPHNTNWLFALELPASLPPRARYLDDGQVMSLTRCAPDQLRWPRSCESQSEPGRRTRQTLERARLPPGFNPRAQGPGRGWRAASASDAKCWSARSAFFRRERLQYTPKPRCSAAIRGRIPVRHAAGFCEHFSSAFVFLMRAAGVPGARGDRLPGRRREPGGRKFTVRQSDAHAWRRSSSPARLDPRRPDRTVGAAAAGRRPGRAPARGHAMPLLMRPELEWLRGLRYNWEALSHNGT
jgi:hypothetical protein